MKTSMLITCALLACSSFAAVAATPVERAAAAAAQQEKEKAKQDPYAVQGSGPHKFDQLKGHEKGYLTLKDVEANSWLAGNFAKCDQDKDGRLTEKEYDACQPRP